MAERALGSEALGYTVAGTLNGHTDIDSNLYKREGGDERLRAYTDIIYNRKDVVNL